MDVDELRHLIRAAVLAMPLAGCASAPAAAPEAPPPGEPVAATPSDTEPSDTEPSDTEPSAAVTPTSRPGDGEMDPDEFERQWRATTRRGTTAQTQPPTPMFRGGPLPPGEPPQVIEGRPLMADHVPVHAALDSSRSWATPRAALGLELEPATRQRVQERWTASALAEHASVASFARAALELMAVGAPAHLVDAHLRAGADELRHAELCFSLAAAYGAPAHGPGPLEVPGVRAGGLDALVRHVFREGCVNESAAALVAQRALSKARPEPVRAALKVIAEDEARHAALAWQTVHWALSREPSLRAALGREQATLAAPSGEREADAEALAEHGLLDTAAIADAQRDAADRLAAPLMAELLA